MFNVNKGLDIGVGASQANKPPHWPYRKHGIIYSSAGGAS